METGAAFVKNATFRKINIMKTIFTLCVTTLLASCNLFFETVTGSGNVIKETRQIDGFTGVKVAGPMDVELNAGDTYKVELEADDNLLKYLIIEKRGSNLEVRLKDNINLRNVTIHIAVQMPSVKNVEVAGSGSVTSHSRLAHPDKMHLIVGGSGNILMDINSPKVEASIGGSGNIKLQGETRDLDISIGGSGSFAGKELKSEKAQITIGGAGDVVVNASLNLDVTIGGSGSVQYVGSPSIKQSIGGSGSVTPIK